jgi:hypothetical protein
VLPIGTSGSGEYFLMACDDSGVWRKNVHMRHLSVPVRVGASAADFFLRLADDWRKMAAGHGPPYTTG